MHFYMMDTLKGSNYDLVAKTSKNDVTNWWTLVTKKIPEFLK